MLFVDPDQYLHPSPGAQISIIQRLVRTLPCGELQPLGAAAAEVSVIPVGRVLHFDGSFRHGTNQVLSLCASEVWYCIVMYCIVMYCLALVLLDLMF